MAASLVVAGRGSGHKEASARQAVEKFVTRYAAQMRAFAQMPSLEVGRFQVHRLNQVEPVLDALLKAERSTALHTLDQLTEPASGKPGAPRRFKELKPTLTRVTGRQAAAVLASLGPYRQTLEPQRQHLLSLYRPVDVAFKVVGTGSVGLRDYCIYFEGNGPTTPCFCRSRKSRPPATRPICPTPIHPATTASAPLRAKRRCRCSPTRSSAGRTLAARLPGPPAQRPQGFHRFRRPGRRRPGGLCRGLRRAAGPRPRPLRRPTHSGWLHWLRRWLRRGSGQVRLPLR